MAVKQTPLTAGNPSYLDVLSSGVLTDTNKIRTAVERTKLAVFEKEKQSTHCQRTLTHDGIHSRPKKKNDSHFFSSLLLLLTSPNTTRRVVLKELPQVIVEPLDVVLTVTRSYEITSLSAKSYREKGREASSIGKKG
jgi:hypothetical protein